MSNLPFLKTTAAATSMTVTIEIGEEPDRFFAELRSAANALVNKPQPFHFCRVEKVASVEHNGMGQQTASALEVQLFELFPFRGNHQSVATLGNLVHILDVGY